MNVDQLPTNEIWRSDSVRIHSFGERQNGLPDGRHTRTGGQRASDVYVISFDSLGIDAAAFELFPASAITGLVAAQGAVARIGHSPLREMHAAEARDENCALLDQFRNIAQEGPGWGIIRDLHHAPLVLGVRDKGDSRVIRR